MTWHLDPDTGTVYRPDGQEFRQTADGPPYRVPDDVQAVVYPLVEDVGIANLTDQQLIWLFECAGGDVELGVP